MAVGKQNATSISVKLDLKGATNTVENIDDVRKAIVAYEKVIDSINEKNALYEAMTEGLDSFKELSTYVDRLKLSLSNLYDKAQDQSIAVSEDELIDLDKVRNRIDDISGQIVTFGKQLGDIPPIVEDIDKTLGETSRTASGITFEDLSKQIAESEQNANNLRDMYDNLTTSIAKNKNELDELYLIQKRTNNPEQFALVKTRIDELTGSFDRLKAQQKELGAIIRVNSEYQATFADGKFDADSIIAYTAKYSNLGTVRKKSDKEFSEQVKQSMSVQKLANNVLEETAVDIDMIRDNSAKNIAEQRKLESQLRFLKEAFKTTYDPKLAEGYLSAIDEVSSKLTKQKSIANDINKARALGFDSDESRKSLEVVQKTVRDFSSNLDSVLKTMNIDAENLAKIDATSAIRDVDQGLMSLQKNFIITADNLGVFAKSLSDGVDLMFVAIDGFNNARVNLSKWSSQLSAFSETLTLAANASKVAGAADSAGAIGKQLAASSATALAGATGALSTGLATLTGWIAAAAIPLAVLAAGIVLFIAVTKVLSNIQEQGREQAKKNIDLLKKEVDRRREFNKLAKEGDTAGVFGNLEGQFDASRTALMNIDSILTAVDKNNERYAKSMDHEVYLKNEIIGQNDEYALSLKEYTLELKQVNVEIQATIAALPSIISMGLLKFQEDLRKLSFKADLDALAGELLTASETLELAKAKAERSNKTRLEAVVAYNATVASLDLKTSEGKAALELANERMLNTIGEADLAAGQLTNAQLRYAAIINNDILGEALRNQAMRLKTVIDDFVNSGDADGAINRLSDNLKERRSIYNEIDYLQEEQARIEQLRAEALTANTEESMATYNSLGATLANINAQISGTQIRLEGSVNEFGIIMADIPTIINSAMDKLRLSSTKEFLKKVEDFRTRIADLNRDNGLEDLRQSATRTKEDLDSAKEFSKNMLVAEKQYQADIESLRADHLNKLGDLEKEHAKDLEESEKAFNEEAQKTQDDYYEEQGDALADHQRSMRQAEEEFNRNRLRRLEDVQDQLFDAELNNDALAFINTKRQAEKDAKREQEDFDRSQQEAADAFALENAEKQLQFQESLTESREQYQKERAEKIKAFELSLTDERANYDKERALKNQEHLKNMNDISMQYKTELAARAASRKQEDDALRIARAEQLQTMQLELEKERLALSESYTDTEELREAHEGRLAEINQMLVDNEITPEQAEEMRTNLTEAFTTASEFAGTKLFDALFNPDSDNFGFTEENMSNFAKAISEAAADSFAVENELLAEDLTTTATERAQMQIDANSAELTALTTANTEKATAYETAYANEQTALDTQNTDRLNQLDEHFYGAGGIFEIIDINNGDLLTQQTDFNTTELDTQSTQYTALLQNQTANQTAQLTAQQTFGRDAVALTQKNFIDQARAITSAGAQQASVIGGLYRQINSVIVQEAQNALSRVRQLAVNSPTARPTQTPVRSSAPTSRVNRLFNLPRIAAAEGAIIDRPTLLLAGDGSKNEKELVLPFNKSSGIADSELGRLLKPLIAPLGVLPQRMASNIASGGKTVNLHLDNITVGANVSRGEVESQLNELKDAIIEILSDAVN